MCENETGSMPDSELLRINAQARKTRNKWNRLCISNTQMLNTQWQRSSHNGLQHRLQTNPQLCLTKKLAKLRTQHKSVTVTQTHFSIPKWLRFECKQTCFPSAENRPDDVVINTSQASRNKLAPSKWTEHHRCCLRWTCTMLNPWTLKCSLDQTTRSQSCLLEHTTTSLILFAFLSELAHK